ncbi:hypothetical protein M406DRAFT_72571 [Cryphonectria parasitica EP155]|uniref:Uncharacterized protein n=1 Tax=Cryphonectria parasitica (strain ATCC 38755 / EP155) TaxID=660469 RepID=A0A9P4XXH8_CRYP1|nr:uncharacterized protein M406DRAFT_72571 [Cryphonectria parasitica EP155]KAF3762580.1 hypothetical protein M406DRAFT_72571 [Cryphonectria parasitica EP155]
MAGYSLVEATTTLVNEQAYIYMLVKSSTGKLDQAYVPIPRDDLKGAAKASIKAYKAKVPKAKRLFYRCVLGKKTQVSMVTLAKTTNSHMANGHGYRPVIKTETSDPIMTDAMDNLDGLNEVDPDEFFELYKNAIGSGEGPRNAALLIHLADGNKVALKVIGGALTTAAGATIKWLADNIMGNMN